VCVCVCVCVSFLSHFISFIQSLALWPMMDGQKSVRLQLEVSVFNQVCTLAQKTMMAMLPKIMSVHLIFLHCFCICPSAGSDLKMTKADSLNSLNENITWEDPGVAKPVVVVVVCVCVNVCLCGARAMVLLLF
jgi:hypothetical protein